LGAGDVDGRACYEEVLRRAEQAGYDNYAQVCPYERFEEMAFDPEQGKMTKIAAREAIVIFQREAMKFYKDAKRFYYTDPNGKIIPGLDCAITSVHPDFVEVDFIEVKHAVPQSVRQAQADQDMAQDPDPNKKKLKYILLIEKVEKPQNGLECNVMAGLIQTLTIENGYLLRIKIMVYFQVSPIMWRLFMTIMTFQPVSLQSISEV
jgi:hypothetical protein